MLLIDNCLLERQGVGVGVGVERWAERQERKESVKKREGLMVCTREGWRGEVGDRGKRGRNKRGGVGV